MAKKGRDADPDEISPADAAEAARLLAEAAAMLPPDADLAEFRGFLDAGAVAAAWEALRSRAGHHPTPFGFWMPMSKAADLLGDE